MEGSDAAKTAGERLAPGCTDLAFAWDRARLPRPSAALRRPWHTQSRPQTGGLGCRWAGCARGRELLMKVVGSEAGPDQHGLVAPGWLG